MYPTTPEPYGTDVIKINKWKYYRKRGYIIVDEVWEGYGIPTQMKSAYSLPNFYYIGDSISAYRYWKKWGIISFEPASGSHPIKDRPIYEEAKQALLEGHIFQFKKSPSCSIGWSERDQKWYGWSHRAIYGFKPGSKIKKGNCAYIPGNKEEVITNILQFWDFDRQGNWIRPEWWGDDKKENVSKKVMNEMILDIPDPYNEQEGLGMIIDYTTHVIDDRGLLRNKSWHKYPEFGKGEWEAKNWDDAKQMAIDFADGVN